MSELIMPSGALTTQRKDGPVVRRAGRIIQVGYDEWDHKPTLSESHNNKALTISVCDPDRVAYVASHLTLDEGLQLVDMILTEHARLRELGEHPEEGGDDGV